MEPSDRQCGVVVTFHPDETVVKNLAAVVAECGRVFVVDNGSSAETRTRLVAVAGVELIALGENRGVATALNIGARRALAAGCRWLVTLDQDSTPRAGMVAALRATAAAHPRAAVVAPRIHEGKWTESGYRWIRRHPGCPWWFQRVPCATNDLPAVTVAVTSGSMIDLGVWQELGGFADELFIDYVDIDYCLKVVRSGRDIAVSAGANLDHKLGARRSGAILGHEFRPMHHPAFRHYFMARNRVWTWRRHARAVPHWAVFDASFAVYNALRVLAFEPAKWTKAKAMMFGLWDGMRGRAGPCPETRWRSLALPRARRDETRGTTTS